MITIASFLFCILNECFVFSIPINSLHYSSFDLGSESRAMLENFLSTPTTFLRVLISSIRFHSCFVLPLLLRVAGVNFGRSPVYNRQSVSWVCHLRCLSSSFYLRFSHHPPQNHSFLTTRTRAFRDGLLRMCLVKPIRFFLPQLVHTLLICYFLIAGAFNVIAGCIF